VEGGREGGRGEVLFECVFICGWVYLCLLPGKKKTNEGEIVHERVKEMRD
jgi:hypothetical protein